MKPFAYTGQPGRALFGAGAIDKLNEEIEALGCCRALVCCTPGRVAEVERITAPLGPAVAGVCTDARPFTPKEAAEAGRQAARETAADCLIAFGGGNAVGLAKAIALELDIPIVAVPTTFSGSETTALQGIIENGKRVQNISPRMMAKVLIYDPALTLEVPMSVLIPSGGNSMAHAVGGLLGANSNPVTCLYAEEGLRVMAGALDRMTANPEDLEPRADALYGAWLNATTLQLGSGANIHHNICHMLGGGLGLPHASAHTVMLPHSTGYNRDAAPEAMKAIGRALKCEPAAVPGTLFDLFERVGAPTSLRALGLPEDALDGIADHAATDFYYSNPRPIERDPVRAMLDDAWHGRRPA